LADFSLALQLGCYNLPADRIPTYANSYHGLAARAGSQSVANCASCHGVHNIFPSSDPRSTVNAANLAHTCGACHSGAHQTFVMGPVHVSAGTRLESATVRWTRLIYLVLISVTIGFMFFHHFLDFWRKLRSRLRVVAGRKQVLRMNLHFRIVVFDPDVYPMDHAWLTGKTSAEHVRRTRPGYYAQLTTAVQPQRAEHDQVSANQPSAAQD
jgi:hypothetical protein